MLAVLHLNYRLLVIVLLFAGLVFRKRHFEIVTKKRFIYYDLITKK